MVGKYALFILLYSFLHSIHLVTSVALRVDGVDHYEAIVGETFTVDFTIKGIPKGFADPVIENIPHGSIQRSGLYMSTINGKSEIRYAYHVRFDEPGSYMLGPVTIVSNGNKFQSNQLTISVSHQKSTPEDRGKQEIFLQLTTDTDTAVIGQAITCTLSCYVKRRGITIERIIPPHVTKAQLSNEQRIPQSEEMIDGVQHAVLRWTWQITPSGPGELTIPAAAIEYTTQTRNRGSLLFSLFSDAKRLYSNACITHISPLPEYHDTCHAIGQFSDFSALLSPTIIKKGEATTITLTLNGNGTFVSQLHYDLENIPDAIRYYAVDPKQNNDEYAFEYIAQGIAEGIYTIPEQVFTFFNTSTKQYEQLHTTPLELHITENSALVSTQIDTIDDSFPEAVSESDTPNSHNTQQEESLFKNPWFQERFVQSSQAETKIPWSLFFFFVTILLLIKSVFVSFSRFLHVRQMAHRILFKFRVLIAIRKLYRIETKDDRKQLHQLFVSLIAFLYKCSENEIYLFLPDFDEKLKDFSHNNRTWNDFFESLLRPIYTNDLYDSKKINIYDHARYWLRCFLKFQ